VPHFKASERGGRVQRLRGLIQLIRPLASVTMGVAVLVGAVLADPCFSIFSLNILFAVITGFTLTAAAMALNDYYDHDIDAINEPSRPIPNNLVTIKSALILTGIFTTAGFIFAYLTSILCFVASLIAWIIMMTYSTIGKQRGLSGNLLVSACVAIPFLYGSLAVVNMVRLNILLFASMAFLLNTGREVTKGIVDVEGDRSKSVRTLAVVFGERKAAVGAAAFYVSTVCLSALPFFLNLVSLWYIPFAVVTDVCLLWCSVTLVRNSARESARRIKRFVFKLFIIGLLGFVFSVL
jgi:geranylgeranylglycerol-phosphate geranylgeranyltransferase